MWSIDCYFLKWLGNTLKEIMDNIYSSIVRSNTFTSITI